MTDKDTLVSTLVREWSSIDDLLALLPAEKWARASALPGWSVHDVVSHIVGAELGLAGEQPPVDPDVRSRPHVHNDIAAINECWVQLLRADSPAQLHAKFRDITAKRAKTLQEMSEEDFNAPSWTPSGQGTYARYMQIRVFDCWMHEQDIRVAVDMPGNETGPAAETSLDEITAALGYIVGKRAGAPDGASVTFVLTGPARRTIHVVVEGRARVVDELPGPATTTLSMSSTVFTRLAGGRIPVDLGFALVEIEGDPELGKRVVHGLPFTI